MTINTVTAASLPRSFLFLCAALVSPWYDGLNPMIAASCKVYPVLRGVLIFTGTDPTYVSSSDLMIGKGAGERNNVKCVFQLQGLT